MPPYAMALVYAGLGEREAVFEWLDKAYAARDVHLIYLPVDAKWDPYRSRSPLRRAAGPLRLHVQSLKPGPKDPAYMRGVRPQR